MKERQRVKLSKAIDTSEGLRLYWVREDESEFSYLTALREKYGFPPISISLEDKFKELYERELELLTEIESRPVPGPDEVLIFTTEEHGVENDITINKLSNHNAMLIHARKMLQKAEKLYNASKAN